MPKTPDRRPGALQEDTEIQFYDNPVGPSVEGAFNYNGDEFVFRDSTGSYNPRGGGVFNVSSSYITTAYTASFFSGLSGSLTKLTDGTSYLVAGDYVSIVSQSNGSVHISSSLKPSVLVVQQGGVTSGNVFATWDEMMTAFNQTEGDVIISIDNSVTSPVLVSVGTHELEGRAILQGHNKGFSFPSRLNLPDGAIVRNVKEFNSLDLFTFATTSPNFEFDNDGFVTFEDMYLNLGGSQPFTRISGGDAVFLLFKNSVVVDNTSTPLLDIAGTGTFVAVTFRNGSSCTDDDLVTGASTTDLYFTHDSQFTVGNTPRLPTFPNYLGTVTTFADDNSKLVGYDDTFVPSTLGSSYVQGAIDVLKRRWISTTANALYTTSSVAIVGNEPSVDAASDKGTDVFFYASGSIGSRNGSTPGVSLFGGDVVVSGTLGGNTYLRLANTQVTGTLEVTSGITGSLTRLTNGSQYIVAGPNISIATSSIGQISITASISGDGSPGNVLTADGDGGATAQGNLIFDGNTLFVYGDAYVQTDLNVDGVMASINTTNLDIKDPVIGIGFASGSVKQTAGDRGWIGGLQSLDNVLFKWDNTNSEFAMARTTASSTASLPIPISSYSNLHVANIQASIITASLGFSGSLTKLSDGSSYLNAGTNISVVSASNGSITISAPNLALASAQYVTIGNDANLTNERALTPGTGLTLTDGGANSTVTLSINDSVVATISGSTFTGAVKFNSGLSGSLTQLVDGTSYIRSGDYITVSSASNGAVTISGTGIAPVGSSYVTIGNDSTLTNERALTPGTGLSLTDGGANSTVTLSINDSIVATVSGTTFTGVTKHNAGLSGSLTQLTDGSSYLVAGSGIQITSASNGAVTVTNVGQTPPGGSETQVQFHDTGGVFGGSSLFTFNKSTGAVTASTFVGNVIATSVDASSVVSGSKIYADTSVESNGYIRLNPGIEYSSIPIGTSESSFMYLTGTNGAVHFAHYDDNENAVSIVNTHLYDQQLQTSLNWGGLLSTAVGSTTFSISSGSGYIVRYNTSPGAEPHPFVKEVSWNNFVSQSLTYLTSSATTYIALDENAGILQQTTPFSTIDSNDIIVLGRVNHAFNVTNGVVMFPETTYGQVSSFVDFARAFGPLKSSGHILTPSGSSLKLNKSAGASFIIGGHYLYNQDRPNYITDTEDTDKIAPVFIYTWVSGSTTVTQTNAGVGYPTIDPNNYITNGVKTALPAGTYTNLRIFYQPLNAQSYLTMYYGQNYYSTLDDAKAAILTEDFTEGPASLLATIFCGYVSVQSGSTDLSDAMQAKITQAGLFRSVPGSGAGAGGGGGGTPGGLDTYVQYNQGGTTFAGDAQFTFNSTTNVLTVGNAMIGGTGELMGSSATFDLLDTTVQTINFGGAATTIDVGSTGGTTNLYGAIKAPQGLSGSLTKLTDGSSYLISSGNISITSASNGAVTVGTTAISATEHKTLRQLIHLAEEGGPFEGFTLGSYREVLPSGDPFPTSVIWWETSAKLKKIVEETITYNSQKLITTDQWKVYDTDGSTVLATATDTINYTGVFETNRTRTIT